MAACTLLLFYKGSLPRRASIAAVDVDLVSPVAPFELFLYQCRLSRLLFIIFVETTAAFVSLGLRMNSYVQTSDEYLEPQLLFLARLRCPLEAVSPLHIYSNCDL